MYDDLKGKVALVTGSGSGIGRAIALALADEGVDVAINVSKSADQAQRVADEVRTRGGRSGAYLADVADRAAVERMVQGVAADFGRLDILVNNAGVPGPVGVPLEQLDLEGWKAPFEVNLHGAFHCCQAAFPHLAASDGAAVVNISSVAALRPLAFWGGYSASKLALIMLTKQLALEWAEKGIRANCIAPGIVVTPRTQRLTSAPALSEPRLHGIPMHRYGAPEEIANAALFLASTRSTYMTGQVLAIDGGEADYSPVMADWARGMRR